MVMGGRTRLVRRKATGTRAVPSRGGTAPVVVTRSLRRRGDTFHNNIHNNNNNNNDNNNNDNNSNNDKHNSSNVKHQQEAKAIAFNKKVVLSVNSMLESFPELKEDGGNAYVPWQAYLEKQGATVKSLCQ